MNAAATSQPPIKCPRCKGNNVETTVGTFEQTHAAGPFVIRAEVSRCGNCENEFFTHAQSKEYSRAVANQVREAQGLLAPERIKQIRLSLGMSQETFERALGTGKKTVGRWERGTVVPNGSANRLMLYAERYPLQFRLFATWVEANADRPGQTVTVIRDVRPAQSTTPAEIEAGGHADARRYVFVAEAGKSAQGLFS